MALSVERDHLREGGQVERKTLPRFADREVDRRVELEEQPREALLLGEALAAGDVVEHSLSRRRRSGIAGWFAGCACRCRSCNGRS